MGNRLLSCRRLGADGDGPTARVECVRHRVVGRGKSNGERCRVDAGPATGVDCLCRARLASRHALDSTVSSDARTRQRVFIQFVAAGPDLAQEIP